MDILVTGISGYVGSRLASRLLADGHTVRGMSRSASTALRSVELARADAISGAGLDRALAGIDVAYYLIHSMEPSPDGAFDARERTAAENFARAARAAGVQRIIYLGGPAPSGAPPSTHLASRLAVEEVLLAALPCSVAFRASIVIGAGSRSFRFLVRLVERMPVLIVPAWRTHRTSPVDERDVIELLARAATNERVCGQSLDAAGRDVVTYGELIDRIRELMLVSRPTIGLRRLTLTPIASRISALIAGEQHTLIGPLMDGLDADLLPRDNRGAQLLGVRLHSLDAAIEHALREWELTEPLAAR
ncbi:MAG: NAD(P)H-binding protein [Solirubrobacteraceae bacterium]